MTSVGLPDLQSTCNAQCGSFLFFVVFKKEFKIQNRAMNKNMRSDKTIQLKRKGNGSRVEELCSVTSMSLDLIDQC